MYEWLKDYEAYTDQISYLQLKSKQYPNDEQLKKRLSVLEIKRKELISLVRRFKGLEQRILVLKYIDGKTLEDIAYELNYSASHIYKKHSEIIKRINFAFSEG